MDFSAASCNPRPGGQFTAHHWAAPALVLFFIGMSLCQEARPAETNKAAKPTNQAAVVSATNAVPGLRVKTGFRIEVVAQPPMVAAPVAMAFDENGRLFVVEMRDFPNGRSQTPHLGRIRVLVASEEDGAFHDSSVYADNLPLPSAVACYDGGIFVAATPEVLFLKDRKGDGTADQRQVVFSGFGGQANELTALALPNNFKWGLDNRIHGATAGIDGTVSAPSTPLDSPVPLAGCDFSFEPRARVLAPELGPAQSGLSFDNFGRKYLSDFTRSVRLPMIERRYLERNPFFTPPPEILDAASPATMVFTFLAPNTVKPAGVGRAPAVNSRSTNAPAGTWLTMARGLEIYRGTAFPTNYLGNAFVADPEAHIIHRVLLRENGLEVVAERAADEPGTEFVISRDPSFRPMQIINGPDGALYVADLNAGGDQGRILRIVPENFKPPKAPRLGNATMYELVATLAHPNGWQADTAARLLYQRQELSAVALLTNMVNNSRLPLARIRALHALAGLGAMREAQVLKGLKDPDERVREHALQVSERLGKAGLSEELWARLRALATDPSSRVRYQLALTLGEMHRPEEAIPIQIELLARNLDNPWMKAAVLSSLAEGAGQMLSQAAGDRRFRNAPRGQEVLGQLAEMTGLQGRLDEVMRVLAFMEQSPLTMQASALLAALGEGLHRTASSLALVDQSGRLQRFYLAARENAVNEGLALPLRVTSIRLLGVSPYSFADISDWLWLLLGPAEPPAIQSAALAAIGHFNAPEVATGLIERWTRIPAALRAKAVNVLLARTERANALLMALESARIAPSELSSVQIERLRTHRDPAVSRRATPLFGATPFPQPGLVERFLPVLRAAGSAPRGHELFVARCAACHRLGGEGQAVGPDLAGAKLEGREKVLRAILKPGPARKPEYATVVVATREGEEFVGVAGDQAGPTVVLRQSGGNSVVLPHDNIDSIHPQRWSFMPEGLEQGFSLQDMADLLEYLMTTPR